MAKSDTISFNKSMSVFKYWPPLEVFLKWKFHTSYHINCHFHNSYKLNKHKCASKFATWRFENFLKNEPRGFKLTTSRWRGVSSTVVVQPQPTAKRHGFISTHWHFCCSLHRAVFRSLGRHQVKALDKSGPDYSSPSMVPLTTRPYTTNLTQSNQVIWSSMFSIQYQGQATWPHPYPGMDQ